MGGAAGARSLPENLRFPRGAHGLRGRELGRGPDLGRRAGGILTGITLALALAAAAWFLWVLESDVEAANFTRVEPSRVRVDVGSAWFDRRWAEDVRALVAQRRPFACDDSAESQRVAAELATLPFVLRASAPQVLWPDGLRIELELRSPIACVQVGREYLAIANDGMLLPGAWPAPPSCGAGWLPVIALDEQATRDARPGAVLWSDVVADSLSVASSMWAELESDDLARLGRTIIDARKARLASVEEPGTVIHLEYSRRILFGRAPSTREPGELPVAAKWLNVANALLCLPTGTEVGPDQVDWELVEVRWDHPAMLPRGGPPAAKVPVKSVKAPHPVKPADPAPPASNKQGRVQ